MTTSATVRSGSMSLQQEKTGFRGAELRATHVLRQSPIDQLLQSGNIR